MGVPRFEVKRGPQSKFQWKYFNSEGKAIAEGIPASQKEICYQEIRAIKENAMHPERYKPSGNGGEKFAFKIHSPNHKVIVESIIFATKEERDQAMDETRRSGEAAVIEQKK